MRDGTPIVAAVLALLLTGRCHAGPPLAIEDAGITDPGRWELIVAAAGASTDSADVVTAPQLDLTIGLVDDLQFVALVPHVLAEADGSDSEAGFGNPQAGLNWRLWNEGDVQITLAPLYTFGIREADAARGLGAPTDTLTTQLIGEWAATDRSRIITSINHLAVEDDEDLLQFGIAAGHQLTRRLELLAEAFSTTRTSLDDESIALRVGGDFALSDRFHLLFSVGKGVRDPRQADELDFDAYLGLQYLP